jgi:hypothetical protein
MHFTLAKHVRLQGADGHKVFSIGHCFCITEKLTGATVMMVVTVVPLRYTYRYMVCFTLNSSLVNRSVPRLNVNF